MIKDGVEELQRFKQDKNENHQNTKRYMKEKTDFETCLWKDIHKGDLLLIDNNQTIPCDMIILSTENE